MDQNSMKQQAAQAALDYIKPKLLPETIIGVGTGSTTNYFIDALAAHKGLFNATVSSSQASTERLKKHGMQVFDLNSVDKVDVYVDGADECNHQLQLIKGGGAALTREKIIAAVAKEFVCIADESKLVDILGEFPLPVEVIPMARGHVARAIAKLGGDPVLREDVVTDNGNIIIDVYNFKIMAPLEMEQTLNNISGVVTNGLFARRGADLLILGTPTGSKVVTRA